MSEAANVRAMNAALNATYAAIEGHTSGPWSVDWERGVIDAANGYRVIFLNVGTRRGDALLIAAAPQLFEVLLRARSYIEAKVSPAERARGPLLAIIDAALAKARDAEATVVHARRADARWPKDDVPLCNAPGNTPLDLYSNDARRVSCLNCLRLLEDEQ